MKHEEFIQRVREIVLSQTTLDEDTRKRLSACKLVYGIGDGSYRGICHYNAWQNGEPHPTDLCEVAASGEEHPVQLAGTTIHELGHVLTHSGHDKTWKEACARLGLVNIQAAGTDYTLENFVPAIRADIEKLSFPSDGKPVFGVGRVRTMGLPMATKTRPCQMGIGARGGKSRGTGSGSRLRKFICACDPKAVNPKTGKPFINSVRRASDEFNATCNACGTAFKREETAAKKQAA